MTPEIIALLTALSGLGKGISAAGEQLAASKAAMGPEAQDRLKELRRQEEMNALGLTDAERTKLEQQLISPLQAQAKEQFARTGSYLASQDLGSGKALGQAMKAQEGLQEAKLKAESQIAQADMQRARQQEAQLMALQDRADQAKAARQSALSSFFGAAIGGAGDIGIEAALTKEATAQRNLMLSGNETDPELIDLWEKF